MSYAAPSVTESVTVYLSSPERFIPPFFFFVFMMLISVLLLPLNELHLAFLVRQV